MPRYQRVRPKYGQSALHLSSGRENKQALSGEHEIFHQLGSPYMGWLLEVRILSRDSNYNVFPFTIL